MPWCARSLQAPLRMEMKGVCNEFHSARVPDPTAISQLRGENQREGRETGVRDGGKKRLKGKHRAFFSFFLSFFFFFTPPLLVPGCQAATMLSWPFFRSIGNSVGSSHGGRRGEGNGFGQGVFERGRRERERERERERGGGGEGQQSRAERTGEMIGLNREQRDKVYFPTRTYGR